MEHSKFQSITGVKQITKHLEECCNANSSVIIWGNNAEVYFTGKFENFDKINKKFNLLPSNPNLFLNEADKILSNKNNSYYFCITSPRILIFFYQKILDVNCDEISISIPKKVFSVQRRKNFRVQIPPSFNINLLVDHPEEKNKKLRFKILDLSSGGLSFTVHEKEMAFYKKNYKFKNAILNLFNTKISVDLVIKHIQEVPRKNISHRHRVGVVFSKINHSGARELASFLLNMSKKNAA